MEIGSVENSTYSGEATPYVSLVLNLVVVRKAHLLRLRFVVLQVWSHFVCDDSQSRTDGVVFTRTK